MVSFVILNYNTAELTRNCVQSIIKYVPAGTYEIIVVDNASSDEERKMLTTLESDVCTLVRSKKNIGFGAGNMLGANVANGDYLCFINSDVIFVEDCISPLVSYLQTHPDVGCVTPQQYNGEGKHARSFRHKTGIRHELFGDGIFEKLFPKKYPNPDQDFGGKELEVTQLNGSFMMFPTDKFWAIGGFDINIFLYYEEYDVGMRINRCGWKNVVLTAYKFHHLYGATMKKARSMTRRELFISKLYTYDKHHNWFLSSVYRVLNIIILSVKPSKWYILSAIMHHNTLAKSMRH